MKKVWKKPKLVGIYRAESDEAVLSGCKNSRDQTYTDPNNDAAGCQRQDPDFGCVCCNDCNVS